MIQNPYTQSQTCRCTNQEQTYYSIYNLCQQSCEYIYTVDNMCEDCDFYKQNSTHCICTQGYYDILLKKCITCPQNLQIVNDTCYCNNFQQFNPYTLQCQTMCQNQQVQTINSTCIDCPNQQLLQISIMRQNFSYYCQCENYFAVYDFYENQCIDCNDFNLTNLFTTCQCQQNQTFDKENKTCIDKCTQYEYRDSQQNCVLCPENVTSIDQTTCNCYMLNPQYNFISQFNICSECPNNTIYNGSIQSCQCSQYLNLSYDEFEGLLYCDYDCNSSDLDTLKYLNFNGFCFCPETQFFNVSEGLCFDCVLGSLQGVKNDSCNCSIQENKIWFSSNQCEICNQNSQSEIQSQICLCEFNGVNQTFNEDLNYCEINCSMQRMVLNEVTMECIQCPQGSIYNSQEKSCTCESQNSIFDDFQDFQCFSCEFGINIQQNQCNCQFESQIFNIYAKTCIFKCNTEQNFFILNSSQTCYQCPGTISLEDVYYCECNEGQYLNKTLLQCMECQSNASFNNQTKTCVCDTYFTYQEENNSCILTCDNNTVSFDGIYCYNCIQGQAYENQCICQNQLNYSYRYSQCIECEQNSVFSNETMRCECLEDQNYFYDDEKQKCVFKCKNNEVRNEKLKQCIYCGQNIQIKRNQCWCPMGFKYQIETLQCIEQSTQIKIISISLGICGVGTIILTIMLFTCKDKPQNNSLQSNKMTFKEKIQSYEYNRKIKKNQKKMSK